MSFPIPILLIQTPDALLSCDMFRHSRRIGLAVDRYFFVLWLQRLIIRFTIAVKRKNEQIRSEAPDDPLEFSTFLPWQRGVDPPRLEPHGFPRFR
jgi:hypothetical protein